MKKIFFITILLLLGFIFLPNLIEANNLGRVLEKRICDIIKFIRSDIVPYAGGLGLIIAGILFMLSGGNPAFHNQAKQALIYIVIGIIVIFGATELIRAIVGRNICG